MVFIQLSSDRVKSPFHSRHFSCVLENSSSEARATKNLSTPKISVLTVKKLCWVQNRQPVYSKLKKTKQLALLGNSHLAEFDKTRNVTKEGPLIVLVPYTGCKTKKPEGQLSQQAHEFDLPSSSSMMDESTAAFLLMGTSTTAIRPVDVRGRLSSGRHLSAGRSWGDLWVRGQYNAGLEAKQSRAIVPHCSLHDPVDILKKRHKKRSYS